MSDRHVVQLSPTVSIARIVDGSRDAFETDFDESEHLAFACNSRYRVGQLIGIGGMGRVFEAHDLDFGRDVALKVLLKQHRDCSDAQRRFFQEAQTTARLQHPGIVSIYDMGVSPDGHPFFSMKLVEGSTLAHLLDTNNRTQLERSRLLNAFLRVCQTMAYAHSRRIIHLDLKPSNIMIGAFGEVHVMDWGLSRSLDNDTASRDAKTEPFGIDNQQMPVVSEGERPADESGQTHFSSARINGTPSYMAPEQASGHNVGIRSDVFGLGAILCEILTGKPPYEGKSTRKVFRRAARGALAKTFRRIESCDADPALIALTKRCLSPASKDRPSDAGVVASDMTAFVESSMERAEHDLCRFFEISMDLFCIASLDGYFKRVNSNFSRVLGYSKNELVSQPFIDFIHPEDISGTLQAVETLAAGNPIAKFQNRYRDAHGVYRLFEWTAKSIPEDNIIFAVARVVES